MSTPHQVSDLAFHLGSGGSVVGQPRGVGLRGAGPGELLLIDADRDGAAAGRSGALRNEATAGAGGPKRGDTATVFDRPDRHAHLPGAGDGTRSQVDGERSLANRPPKAGGDCTLVIIRAPEGRFGGELDLVGNTGGLTALPVITPVLRQIKSRSTNVCPARATDAKYTATRAFSIRPAVPVYWHCTPTVAVPFLT